MPQVSFCLPVYNGERYLHEVLGSIRAQTFDDYELIISDNGSNDATQEICHDLSRQDPRVRYFRADVNRGLAWNLNRTFTVANGKYIMWICHDDRIEPDYVRQCVEALENDKKSILCFSNFYYIDADGRTIKHVDLPNTGAAETPSMRLQQVLYNHECDPIYGIMKAEVVRQTRLHGGYADSDRVLLAELGLRGRFRKLSDYLFGKRIHPGQATAEMDRWQRTLIFDPQKKPARIYPWWRELFGLFGAIQRAAISSEERFKSYKYLYWWILVHRAFLYEDLRRGFRIAATPKTAKSAPSETF